MVLQKLKLLSKLKLRVKQGDGIATPFPKGVVLPKIDPTNKINIIHLGFAEILGALKEGRIPVSLTVIIDGDKTNFNGLEYTFDPKDKETIDLLREELLPYG